MNGQQQERLSSAMRSAPARTERVMVFPYRPCCNPRRLQWFHGEWQKWASCWTLAVSTKCTQSSSRVLSATLYPIKSIDASRAASISDSRARSGVNKSSSTPAHIWSAAKKLRPLVVGHLFSRNSKASAAVVNETSWPLVLQIKITALFHRALGIVTPAVTRELSPSKPKVVHRAVRQGAWRKVQRLSRSNRLVQSFRRP